MCNFIPKDKRILITGGTGFLGRALIKRLYKDNEIIIYSRDEAKHLAQEKGAKISSTISKNTDYLIIGEKPGSKAKKAKELNIRILNEKEWLVKINQ